MYAYFLAGPTASGKTAVAHALAERHGYGILSADSMLIYRGMDIGTAKPTRDERGDVPYYGIDLVDVDQSFNGWQYYTYAMELLKRAEREGQALIVVGGTGLYLKLLVYGMDRSPGPNVEVRAHWESVLAAEGVAPLQAALRTQSPGLYAAIDDAANGRRLVRFLEWAAAGLDAPPRHWRSRESVPPMPALNPHPDLLKSRIEQRVRAMYGQGLLDEVRGLLSADRELSDTARQAIGYAEAIEVLEGRLSQEEAIERTAARTRRLAKRQRTWLRTQAHVDWIEIGADCSTDDMVRQVQAVWDLQGPIEVKRDDG